MGRSQTLSPALGRRTTRSLDPDEKLWVYSRGGKPCRRCGTRDSVEKDRPGRQTYLLVPNLPADPGSGRR